MSMKAAINGFTAWTNMRLSKGECAAESVLQDVMEGERLKLLLQSKKRGLWCLVIFVLPLCT